MTKDVVYLKHKTRTGGLKEYRTSSYEKNKQNIHRDGWRKATIEEIKAAGYEVEEVKPKPKKKNETPKGDEK